MITRRGIKVNPDKCKAIFEMKGPTTVKDVQKLTGWIGALSRFLPCSGTEAVPFFHFLWKNKTFIWSTECEETFQQLKSHQSRSLLLSKSEQGTPLSLYIVVSENAVSSALL